MAYIRCGREYVEWDFAVVWVTPKWNPYNPPTKLLFNFRQPTRASESLQSCISCVEQWTYKRGTCLLPFTDDSPEFRRAKAMAIKVVATYRRKYLKKHGAEPRAEFLTGGATYARSKLR